MEYDDRADALPLYRRIATRIAVDIENRGSGPHAKLPSEIDFAAQFGVSRGTITKALDLLVDRGCCTAAGRAAPSWPPSRFRLPDPSRAAPRCRAMPMSSAWWWPASPRP